MGWFKRKQRDVESQDDMLRDIVQGASPVTSVPVAAPAGAVVSAPWASPPGDVTASIARAMQALGAHADVLRAQGLDPTQLQALLQGRLASGGSSVIGGPLIISAMGNANPSAAFADQVSRGWGPTDLVAELEDLSRLHASGSLSDAEFASAKARLLGAP